MLEAIKQSMVVIEEKQPEIKEEIIEEKPTVSKPITQEDYKSFIRVLVELNKNAKKAGKGISIQSVYEAIPQFDKLFIDALLAKAVQEDKVCIDDSDKSIYLTF